MKPAAAMALLEALPDPSPFETLMDAFRAHADREHLNRLATERRVVVLEHLKRHDCPEKASSDPNGKSDRPGMSYAGNRCCNSGEKSAARQAAGSHH